MPRLRRTVACFSAALMLAVACTGSAWAGDKPAPRRVNIIFILTDDLGINDLSCYGRKDQPTPNLDRLAKQGLRFTNAYAAQPVCSPTRAAILTGKSPARLHVTTFLPGRSDAPSQLLLHPRIAQQLPIGIATLADWLKGAGYATACIGKWHLGGRGSLPTERGFDLYFPGHAHTKPSATEGGKGEYELTTAAEKFIDANKARPFFLYLCHNNPHIPLAAKSSLIEKHKDAFNPVYAAMIETLDDMRRPPLRQGRSARPGGANHHHIHLGQRRPARPRRIADAGDRQSSLARRQGFPLRRRRAHPADRVLARQDPKRRDHRHAGHQHRLDADAARPRGSEDHGEIRRHQPRGPDPARASAAAPAAVLALSALHQPGQPPRRRGARRHLEADRALRRRPLRAVQPREGPRRNHRPRRQGTGPRRASCAASWSNGAAPPAPRRTPQTPRSTPGCGSRSTAIST